MQVQLQTRLTIVIEMDLVREITALVLAMLVWGAKTCHPCLRRSRWPSKNMLRIIDSLSKRFMNSNFKRIMDSPSNIFMNYPSKKMWIPLRGKT